MKKNIKNIKSFFLNLLLFFASIALIILLCPWGIIEILLGLFVGRRFLSSLVVFGDIFKTIAIIIDIIGNVIMQFPFNRILIKKNGYRFGSRFDTISYVLGHNLENNELTSKGVKLCGILDFFDKNHCAKIYNQRLS